MFDYLFPFPSSIVVWAALGVVCYAVNFLLLAINLHPARKLFTKDTVPFAPISWYDTAKSAATKYAPLNLASFAKQYGNAGAFRLPIPVLNGFYVITDHKVARSILKDPLSDKPRGIYQSIMFWKAKGNVFTSPNSFHQRMVRKNISHAFTKKEIDRMVKVFEKHLQVFKTKLDQLAANDQSFDVYHESGRIIFETFLEAAFEYTVEPNAYEEITSIVEDLKSLARKEAKKPLQFMLNYFIPASAKRSDPAIRVFAQKILQTYRQNPNKSTANTIIRAIVDNDQFKNDDERVDEIILFILAGFDTTGTTLSSALVLLAQNPDVANRLSKELVTVSEDERCQVPLFEYVLKESFRMMPITAASLVRETGSDITLKSGGRIPKGAICVMSPFVFGRNDKVFMDPECFNPDRWAHPTMAMKESLLPFGFGVRNCIGQTLAKAELNMIIPTLLAEYEFSVKGEAEIDCAIFLQFTNTNLLVKKRVVSV